MFTRESVRLKIVACIIAPHVQQSQRHAKRFYTLVVANLTTSFPGSLPGKKRDPGNEVANLITSEKRQMCQFPRRRFCERF